MIKTFNPTVVEPLYPNMRDNLGNTMAAAQTSQGPEEEAPENEDKKKAIVDQQQKPLKDIGLVESNQQKME